MTIHQKRFYTVKELRELLAEYHEQMYIMVDGSHGGLLDLDIEVGIISLDSNYEEEQNWNGAMFDICDDNYMDF